MCITWKIAVVGFSPHAYNAEVFAEDACSHLTQHLGPIKEVIAQWMRQPDYNALTLSLSRRSLTVVLLYSPWWLRTLPNSGCVHAWLGNGPSLMRRISNIPIGHRVVDQSHAISWHSVFCFLYWGARSNDPGHNRSSSPSATLADRAERKVPKHRSRASPTFVERHDLELMHIEPNSRRRTLPKVFGLYGMNRA